MILDQIEEYFVSRPDDDGEGTFAVEFPRAVNRRELPVHFLVSIREDALARLDRFKGRIPTLFSNRLHIEHLSRAAARDAIVKPVERFSGGRVRVEEELIDAVLGEVAVGQVRLGAESGGAGEAAAERDASQLRIEAPYLQLVMSRIWEVESAEGSAVLRLSTFIGADRLGGAKAIARSYLDQAMKSLTHDQQALTAQAFRFLVTSSNAKIVWSTKDLANVVGSTEGQLEPVLATLADDRILRPVAPLLERPDEPRYEIFHDVLGPEILDWRNEWERRVAERKRRRLVAAIAVLAILLAGMGALAWVALDQKGEADEQTDRATAQEKRAVAQQLASAAQASLDADATKAVKLALESFYATEAPEPEAVDALSQALSRSRERARLLGHSGWVNDAELSDDGTRAVTSSWDGTARVWDVRTAEPIAVLEGHRLALANAVFSPEDDRVLTAGDDGTARIWDVASEEEVARFAGHSGSVTHAEFSHDGQLVLTAGTDNTARVWDAETEEEYAKLEHGNWVNSAHFSPNDTLVVTASADKATRVWDARSGLLRDEFRIPGEEDDWNPVWAADFSPSGKQVATASEDGNIRIWTVGAETRPIVLRGHSPRAEGVEFSTGSDLLLTWGGKEARVWNLARPRSREHVLGHREWVQAAGFSDDGSLIATASVDGIIRLWESATGAVLDEWHGHGNAPFTVDFSEDGSLLATSSADQTARVWDVNTGSVLRGHEGWVVAAAFNPKRDEIVTAGDDGLARVWQPEGRTWAPTAAFAGHTGGLRDAAYNPAGTLVVTTGKDDWKARVWKPSGEQVDWLGSDLTHESALTSAAFSPDGQQIVTASEDGKAKVWATPTGPNTSFDPLAVLTHEEWRLVTQAAFSPSGKLVATAGVDGEVLVWQWESYREGRTKVPPRRIDVGTILFGVAFHPTDESRLATADADGTARIWEIETGKQMGEDFAGHVGTVTSVTFNADGTRLITTGSDLTTRVWDVPSGRLLSVMRRHADLVNSAAFSRDETLILSASDDGTARIYPCETCSSPQELAEEAAARLEATGVAWARP